MGSRRIHWLVQKGLIMSDGISMKSKGPRKRSKGRTKSGRRYSMGFGGIKRIEPLMKGAKRGSKPKYQLWSGPAGDFDSIPLTMKEAAEMGLEFVWEHHPTTHQEFKWPVVGRVVDKRPKRS